jgi:protein TonB
MKPAAVAATVLLHAAAVGGFVHLHSEQNAAQLKPASFEIALVSNRVQTLGIISAPAKTVFEPSRTATDSFASPNPVGEQPSAPDSAGDKPFINVTPLSDASPPAIPVKTSVSIPASHAATNQKPLYPLLSRRQEEQGTVLLRILVKADGTAGEVQIKQSSGYPLLDESSLIAVQNWRFHPASVNNKPVAEWYQIAIPFTLRN